jgi:hypothetical protein
MAYRVLSATLGAPPGEQQGGWSASGLAAACRAAANPDPALGPGSGTLPARCEGAVGYWYVPSQPGDCLTWAGTEEPAAWPPGWPAAGRAVRVALAGADAMAAADVPPLASLVPRQAAPGQAAGPPAVVAADPAGAWYGYWPAAAPPAPPAPRFPWWAWLVLGILLVLAVAAAAVVWAKRANGRRAPTARPLTG